MINTTLKNSSTQQSQATNFNICRDFFLTKILILKSPEPLDMYRHWHALNTHATILQCSFLIQRSSVLQLNSPWQLCTSSSLEWLYSLFLKAQDPGCCVYNITPMYNHFTLSWSPAHRLKWPLPAVPAADGGTWQKFGSLGVYVTEMQTRDLTFVSSKF